ncbi:MAG: hypothetical protein WCO78_01460 [Candidatus Roizmanbacteria bacterium]
MTNDPVIPNFIPQQTDIPSGQTPTYTPLVISTLPPASDSISTPPPLLSNTVNLNQGIVSQVHFSMIFMQFALFIGTPFYIIFRGINASSVKEFVIGVALFELLFFILNKRFKVILKRDRIISQTLFGKDEMLLKDIREIAHVRRTGQRRNGTDFTYHNCLIKGDSKEVEFGLNTYPSLELHQLFTNLIELTKTNPDIKVDKFISDYGVIPSTDIADYIYSDPADPKDQQVDISRL